ncbi:MAG: TIGR02996 domain-containing protein [Rubripirellula sp.]
MSTESRFLDAIGRQDDSDVRFAYADWLDEADDPRGNMIRIEEEMRKTPIDSDRYWELKPQRHAFQDYCTERFHDQWLVQMGYHRRYAPVFQVMPTDPIARWRLIREFIERWHGIRLLDAGDYSDKITEIETRIGLKLPEAVRQWIALAGDLGPNFAKVFRDRLSVQSISGREAISILRLSEGDVCWAIGNSQLSRADPLVETFYQDAGVGLNHFVPSQQTYGSVTAFALAHASNFLGRGASCLLDKDQLRLLAEQHGVLETRIENLSVYECSHAIVITDETNTQQISIWDNRETRDLHPFIAAQL